MSEDWTALFEILNDATQEHWRADFWPKFVQARKKLLQAAFSSSPLAPPAAPQEPKT
jgi:hypothetical protein